MEKILFDTDMGSDIDDAVCLAYLLSQSQCELLGITTVSGEADKRAKIADAICKSMGKTIPIVIGEEKPLIIETVQKEARQSVSLPNWPHDTEFPTNAIEFMRQTIRENPHEITLLAVGPLTNVALLFKTDPEIPSLLKQLVIMCGHFDPTSLDKQYCEWNSLCDPHASAIVYNTELPIFKSIGLDVTTKVKMSKADVTERFASPVLRCVLDFAGQWFRDGATEITFHDPLAAAVIFQPELCEFFMGTVVVDCYDKTKLGETQFTKNKEGRHAVALSVDANGFFEHYFHITN